MRFFDISSSFRLFVCEFNLAQFVVKFSFVCFLPVLSYVLQTYVAVHRLVISWYITLLCKTFLIALDLALSPLDWRKSASACRHCVLATDQLAFAYSLHWRVSNLLLFAVFAFMSGFKTLLSFLLRLIVVAISWIDWTTFFLSLSCCCSLTWNWIGVSLFCSDFSWIKSKTVSSFCPSLCFSRLRLIFRCEVRQSRMELGKLQSTKLVINCNS